MGGSGASSAARTRRRLRSFAFRIFLLFALVFSFVPDVLSTALGLQCRDWASRPVEVPFFSAAAIADLVEVSEPVGVTFLPDFVDGVALPTRVLVSSDMSMGVYVHEVAHQQQMRDMGRAAFVGEYVSQWLQGRYSGCGPFDAYRSISLERSARHAELMLPASYRHAPFDGDRRQVVLALRRVAERASCPRFVCGAG